MTQEVRHTQRPGNINEVLAAGEIAYSDSDTIKVGDGSRTFAALPELSSNESLGDNSTIIANSAKKIQAHGTLNKNPNASGNLAKVFDWIGTSQEFVDQNIATVHPDWLCFVTDDVSGTMSGAYTRDEIDAFLSNKADGIGAAVMTSGEQTIQGGKYFLNGGVHHKSTTIDSTQIPSEAEYLSLGMAHDKNNQRIGSLEVYHDAGGNIGMGMKSSVGINGQNIYSPDIATWISQDGQTKWTQTITPSNATLNDTQIATTAHIINVLKAIYPVGAIFIGTTSTCPMSAFFGTWELVAADRSLQGSSTNHAANTTIAAGLPEISGHFAVNSPSSTSTSGAFALQSSYGSSGWDGTSGGGRVYDFYASRSSSVYGSSTTVQPPAYVVNVWRRTA